MGTSKKIDAVIALLSYAGLNAFCICVLVAAYADDKNSWFIRFFAGVIFTLLLLVSFFIGSRHLKLNVAIAALFIGALMAAAFLMLF